MKARTSTSASRLGTLPRRDHAHVEPVELRVVRADGQDLVTRGQPNGDPAGSVVHPLAAEYLPRGQAKPALDPSQHLVFDRSATKQGRRRERQQGALAADADQARQTLLDDLVSSIAAPWFSQTWQLPSVGCPAKGNSRSGVKILTR